MTKCNTYLTAWALCAGVTGSIYPASSKTECQQLVRDLGECGGSLVRLVAYDQEVIFGQNDRGSHNCFQLQDLIEELNRDFEQLRGELRKRGQDLKTLSQEQDPTDVRHTAKMMKEQSALDIDAKVAQQEYQMRLAKLQGEFLREVQGAIQELAEEFEWDIVLPVDKKSAFVTEKVDITEKIVKRLNEKYRAKQRTKKFGDTAKKDVKPAVKSE